jgi:hypothetical protein
MSTHTAINQLLSINMRDAQLNSALLSPVTLSPKILKYWMSDVVQLPSPQG